MSGRELEELMSDIGKKERIVRAGKYLGCLEALFLLPSS